MVRAVNRRLLIPLLLALSCGKSPKATHGQPGTLAAFDLDADISVTGNFYELPYPADIRLGSSGKPVLQAFPNLRSLPLIEKFKSMAMERKGYPVVPVAYFRFGAPLAQRTGAELLQATAQGPVLLIDVDASSPQRGRLFPVVVATPPHDEYVPVNLLAVAPRPGFVLVPNRTYAFVVLRSLNDANGAPLGVPAALDELRLGQQPDGILGALALASFAPLWPALATAQIDAKMVAAATVFTTGDVVAETSALSTAIVANPSYAAQISGLALDPAHAKNDRVCVLTGTVKYPQFQQGTPPFNSGGLFVLGADGLPQKQRDENAPMAITLPKQPMPAGGWPLLIYFHGSGGVSTDVIDAGPSTTKGGATTPGLGPGYYHAAFNVAGAGSALPVNPERLPNAADTAYLNFANLPAMRDTFRQGIIEQRLFLEALRTLQLDPALLTGCSGPQLPAGETKFHFNADKLVAQGQSMGGMYTNMISAVEPRIKLAVPTGAGGFWSYFILVTQLYAQPALTRLVADLLYADPALTFLHPALQLVETAWEPADPFVSMPRLARRPLPGHPVRPIYEPVGKGDKYFPTVLYDAIALDYGHQEAGTAAWPTMQDALKSGGLDGLLAYPVKNNRMSEGGVPYTGAVVQYEGDGVDDPHYIYRQLDAVKHQYGCFVSGFLATGTATLVAPAAADAPCE